MSDGDVRTRELAMEQHLVDTLYAHLDALLEATLQRRNDTLHGPVAGTPGSRGERDALLTAYEGRLAQLRAVEDRLCFGRLDLATGERRYVGRLGLSDEQQVPVLIDWRAPAAEPFYQATAASPRAVVRRRHLTTHDRTVTAVEDEVLDLDALDEAAAATLAGEGALMAALDEHRTGRMRDIVATIQAEQDAVIRAPLKGILVVQGGPGTGKTAVALHRAAYLLYTHRDRIARSGVLLVGPNQAFLRYIEQVLPSLGETGVVTSTIGGLHPGIEAGEEPDPIVAALKGDARMALSLKAAVRARQRLPRQSIVLRVDHHRVTLHRQDVAAARSRARSTGKPHNEARTIFVKDLLARLARQFAQVIGHVPDDGDYSDLEQELRDSPDVRREVNLCWMPVTPERLVGALWAQPERLAEAAHHLRAEDRERLFRPIGSPWTAADVPLIDEAAELLGEDHSAALVESAHAAAEQRRELEYAKGVLQMSGTGGLLTAEALVNRYATAGPSLTVAERAAEDRTWTFGHILVDEAQEISPMAWRMLMRRCPSKSMTVVGDLAQTSSLAGANSWSGALDPLAAGRWQIAELTVNYRTPGQIMEAAQRVLDEVGVVATPVKSAREGRWPPMARRVEAYGGTELVSLVAAEAALVAPGQLAVLTPHSVKEQALEVLAALPDTVRDDVVVLSVSEAKGLEFDGVVILAPDQILAESPRGANDLYVAMSRPTQRLLIAYAEPLPAALTGLHPLS